MGPLAYKMLNNYDPFLKMLNFLQYMSLNTLEGGYVI